MEPYITLFDLPDDGPAPRAARGFDWQPLRRAATALALPATLLAAWEALSRSGGVPTHLLPPPSALAATIVELAQQGLAWHVLASALRVGVGFLLGAALGVALGAWVGLNRPAQAVLDPTIQGLRAIPSLAWVPLLLLWLGIDEAPKITLIALGAFFPVYLGLVAGIHDVDRKWVELGAIHGLSRWALIRRILIPASLPSLFTGLRNGLGMAWMFMVAAELIAASKGLGYLLTDGRENSRPDIVLTTIVLLAVLGKLSDGVLLRIEQRSLAWRDTYSSQGARHV